MPVINFIQGCLITFVLRPTFRGEISILKQKTSPLEKAINSKLIVKLQRIFHHLLKRDYKLIASLANAVILCFLL